MSRFLTRCRVEFLLPNESFGSRAFDPYPAWEDDRQLCRYLSPLAYLSDELAGQLIIAPAGLVIDRQSIPRKVAGFTGHEDNYAGGIHDWLYLSHRLRMGNLPLHAFLAIVKSGHADEETERQIGPLVTQEQADLVYREILILNRMDEVHAQQQYAALDFYGQGAYESGPSRLRIEPVPSGAEAAMIDGGAS